MKGNNKGKRIVTNPTESIKSFASLTMRDSASEVSRIPSDFIRELLGIKTFKAQGELSRGEPLELSRIINEKTQGIEEKKPNSLILQIQRQEKELLESRINELRLETKALQEEIISLAETTQEFSQETLVAVAQTAPDPGEYHIAFFQKILEFIRSFRKGIENSIVWLRSFNARSARKNSWVARYQKHGAKYLLSGEHYLQRSAG